MSAMGAALLNQLQVVHALVLRETRTRFGAHQLGYLWALLEPIVWILTFYAMFAALGRRVPMGADIVTFITTGIIPYQLVLRTADRATTAISANKAMLFYPQVRPLDLILARSALENATLGLVFCLLVGAAALLRERTQISSLLMTLSGLGLAGLLGLALGILLCALSVYTNSVQRVQGLLFRPLFWMSGIFFTAESLPSQARTYLLYNPVLHAVEITRDGWFPEYTAHHASASYVGWWIGACLLLGLTLERRARQHIEVT